MNHIEVYNKGYQDAVAGRNDNLDGLSLEQSEDYYKGYDQALEDIQVERFQEAYHQCYGVKAHEEEIKEFKNIPIRYQTYIVQGILAESYK